MPTKTQPTLWGVAKLQLSAISVFLLLFAVIVIVLNWKDRQQEWRLREEQATHRLELAYELITRDLARARSDILYVANQRAIRSFEEGDADAVKNVEYEFGSFLRFKQTCQQLRLVNITGMESVRVDLRGAEVLVIPKTELQDKRSRYYIRESLPLQVDEVFVSDFDLNQEHGVIEQPLNPVIRFVTPVGNNNGEIENLLVANYLGSPLLDGLAAISLPGKTFLIREDGQYLLGPGRDDSWGWLLGHRHSFARQYPDAWASSHRSEEGCFLTSAGAFAFRDIQLQGFGPIQTDPIQPGNRLLIVSHLPSINVFEFSNQLLNRLLILVSVILLPLFVLTRFWAVATIRRKQQNLVILESERKLRELSSRLLKILDEERRAISREIHDQLGQQVTAINLDLKLAIREVQSEKVSAQLHRAIDESEQLLSTLHDFAKRVRPVLLDDLGLHDAVESHLWDFKDRTGIDFNFDSNVDNVSLPPVVLDNMYRLIQESLNNIVKHAHATRVDISIRRMTIEGERVLNVSVKDDGMGGSNSLVNKDADANDVAANSRLGILGMRERVELLGGMLEIVSRMDEGTTVNVFVPLDETTDEPVERGTN